VSIINSHRATTQERQLTSVPSQLSASSDVHSWQRLVAIIALVGMLLSALVGGWIAPKAHSAGVLAATTATMTSTHTLAAAPHITCGALSLPC
jgi:hypothetical protein